ncbi:MAG: exosortase/archaeosortase family protein [Phycisphaerae bacterium]|nr:exosortase/archaeosortase family protein [Phycisphaerae bacterium]
MHAPSTAVGRTPIWTHGIRAGVLALLVVLAYWPELHRIVDKWRTDGDWSHGWLVPLFSLYFLHLQRERLARVRSQTSWLGLIVLVSSLGVYLWHLFITPMGYPRSLSLVATIGAMVLFLGGRQVLRVVWFPIVFLLFAVPIPDGVYVDLTMPLRTLASLVSAFLLGSFIPDLHVDTSGVVIDYVYRGASGQLNVEEACSGMRLMMAFITLGAAMAYLGDRPLWQRIVMLVCCVPIAVFCNVIRVSTTGFLHVFGHRDWAEGTTHELLGLAMLPVALGLFALIGYTMDHLFVEETEDEDEPQGRPDVATAPSASDRGSQT